MLISFNQNINKLMLISSIIKKITVLLVFLLLTSCGIYEKTDSRKIPVNVDERVKKNIQEGRGFRLKDIGKGGSGNFEFASSNEMWRASLSLLDFTPFSNVDYSGGIIITDWFSDENNKNEYLKITVRFLSNEIRADGLEVTIHERTCSSSNSSTCTIKKIKSNLEGEIKLAILKRATKYKNDFFKKKGEEERKKNPGKWKFLDEK